MPRYRKNTLSVRDRLNRSQSQFLRAASWVDPFPDIHGTLPEKMVYAELSRRGIPFLFLNDLRFTIPAIKLDKWYQADFAIPSLKIIIEVQGAYWHSKQSTIEADAFKFAVYEMSGWKVLAWWDFDILSRLQDLFFETPELVAASKKISLYGQKASELPVKRRTKVDTSKGIRTLNERRYRAKMPTTRRTKLRKASSFYNAG